MAQCDCRGGLYVLELMHYLNKTHPLKLEFASPVRKGPVCIKRIFFFQLHDVVGMQFKALPIPSASVVWRGRPFPIREGQICSTRM